MPPHHIQDLYDYRVWIESQLDQLPGTLRTQDGHLNVGMDSTETVMLIKKHRLDFFTGAYLEFFLSVAEDLEVLEYRFHFARADDSWIWRLDKHGIPGSPFAVPHIHFAPGEEDHPPYPEIEVDHVVQRIASSGEIAT